MQVELKNIVKKFGGHVALNDVNLQIQEGKLTSLLGPSGCGKTTMLRIIAGLEKPDSGSVLIDGKTSSLKNNVGFVFQHYSLFPHMDVFNNVAFGLQVKPRKTRLSKEEIKERVHEVLSLVQLDNQSKKYPSQLSGGQQQRIALARVLAIQPKILLLDEPFSALDATVRRDLRRWLRRLHEKIHITTVLVTHDQEEALEISDKVALFNQGFLEQFGSPREVYKNPASRFIYEFLGVVNVFSGRINPDNKLVKFDADSVEKTLDCKLANSEVLFRPHEVEVILQSEYKNQGDAKKVFFGTIIRVSFIAQNVLIEVKIKNADATSSVIEAQISDNLWERSKFKTGDLVVVLPSLLKVF